MTVAIIAASASIVVAVLAFVLNQYGQIRQERRQVRLSRLNSQLRDLYGPLNAMVDANERVWEALRDIQLPGRAQRHPGGGGADWRRWRDEALQPANRQMRDLIFSHADLLVEIEMPEPLREFCAHVAAQEIVRSAEEEGGLAPVLISHPGSSFVSYVQCTFVVLKKEQAQLLRRSGERSSI